MDSPDVSETASGIANGEVFAGFSAKEEKTGISFFGVKFLLFIGINVEENVLAGFGVFLHVIDDFNGFARINVIVPDKYVVKVA